MAIVCEVCRRPATEVFCFQVSKPFFERPRRYRCWDHGGAEYATPEVLHWAREWQDMKRYSCRVPIEEARKLAILRRRAHASNGTVRFARNQFYEDTIGILVELAFEKLTGIRMDRRALPHGDNSIDFHAMFHGEQITIDVKGDDKPKFLFVKEWDIERCSDVLVLAKVWKDFVVFLGWSTREVMQACPVRDFDYGIRNYYLPEDKLYPILDLMDHVSPGG